MSDQYPPAEDPTPVRRVGAKDRKKALKSSGGLFPSETAEPATPETPSTPTKPPSRTRQTVQLDKDDRFPPVAPQNVRLRTPNKQPMARKRRVARHDVIALVFLLASLVVGGYFVYVWQNPYSVINPFPPPTRFVIVTATPGAPISQFFVGRITYASDSTDCEAFRIAGAVTAGTGGRQFAVRVSSETRDDGVLTGNVPGYGENAYYFELPRDTESYIVQLFDLSDVLLADPVTVEVRPGCDFNLVIVNFTPS